MSRPDAIPASAVRSEANTVKPFNRRHFPLDGWEMTLVVLLVLVLVGFSWAAPGFYDGMPDLLSMAENFLPFGFVALGLSLVIFTGGIDLSVSTTASLTAVVVAQLWHGFGMNIWVAAGIGLLLGALLGAINVLVIIRLKIEPLIATLATSFIYGSIATAVAGNAPPSGFPDAFNALGGGALGILPYQLLLFVPLCLGFWLLVARSAYGRKLVMVGYNREVALYSGIRVERILVVAYVLSGVMAAVAGLVLAAYYSAARPDMGDPLLLATLTMVVLGGVSIFGGEGTMLGVILAVFILGFLRQGMMIAGFSDMVTTMVTGAILITSIAVKNLFNKRGTGLGNQLWALLRRPEATGSEPE
ncbi:hypothetical protein U879_07385 [Defluviimonas sp. 20V17]|uniref:Autoinducer 2 import system permease protein LsrD n=1 Tax=Allgaiera indica TaxID=765699 RepID=A0AAN5A311_9RHOB|nr:ABC transporter permease [Allgaiera indica]KDB04325.1 hypothetical protein U879_07385 [Defluviimonas sp. 20V17]GHE06337.1 histidine kinase [Allgaiera indica]SDX91608.1 AI-2 transport system permease protein/rhamnose transport system permease protein [Allgaiera indica]